MTTAVRRLPVEAVSQIRTGVTAPDIAQLAEELVCNAIDVGATAALSGL